MKPRAPLLFLLLGLAAGQVSALGHKAPAWDFGMDLLATTKASEALGLMAVEHAQVAWPSLSLGLWLSEGWRAEAEDDALAFTLPALVLAKALWTLPTGGDPGLGLEAFARRMVLTSTTAEYRLGLVASATLGQEDPEVKPPFLLIVKGGYALAYTYSSLLDLGLWDYDPLLEVRAEWRPGKTVVLAFDLASFSDYEASYFFRTRFGFSGAWSLGPLTLNGELGISYSDFFTETAYLDGLSLCLGGRWLWLP